MRFQTQGHDWYDGEIKTVAPLEKGKRRIIEIAFMEKVMREVRRGGVDLPFMAQPQPGARAVGAEVQT